MVPKVSIVMTVLNAFDLTQKALKSVNSVAYKNKEIIVVDNNSEHNVRALLFAEHGRKKIDTLILNSTNRGFGAACNEGVSAASEDSEYICFFSNDVEGMNDDWLAPLVEVAESKEDVGMVGCRLIYRPDHPEGKKKGKVQHAGCKIKLGKYMNQPNHVINEHQYRYYPPSDVRVTTQKKVEMVTAACFLMRKSLFENIGGFDPVFGIGYCEDLDLCLRLRKAGYSIWYCPQSSLYHFEMIATTTTVGGAAYREQRTKNQEIIDRRWLKFVKEGQHEYEQA